jgi:Ran GTPase-activating protein (RanGAP) involved in mRNA processing and transport
LTKLDLSGNRLSADALAALLTSPAIATVEDLDLGDNNLGAAGMLVLARAELPRVRTLHLARTWPPQEGIAALVEAIYFKEIRRLSLRANNLGQAAAVSLARAAASNLRVLDLSENAIGDRGTIALAGNLPTLIQLDLEEAQIGDAGAIALARAPNLDGLLYLNLLGNTIGAAAADQLRERFGPRLFL